MGPAHPVDYDTDPQRFATNQAVTARFLATSDVHEDVAATMAAYGCRLVVDIGGGNGVLARLLADAGIRAVVVDRAGYVREAPAPRVLGDALDLPFADATFDGAAALFMLYHLDDPRQALFEAYRVLRPGGVLAVCAPSRFNDPEFATILPGWGQASSFEAENAAAIVGAVFDDVRIERWDAPLLHLPDRAAVAMFLRGRGLSADRSTEYADVVAVPMTVTKRGMVAIARKP